MKLIHLVSALFLIAAGGVAGWFISEAYQQRTREQELDSPVAVSSSRTVSKVVAQGRIVPRSGIVNINMPPGQRIETIHVSEGDLVTKGETELASFVGQGVSDLQRKLVVSQGEDTLRELDQKIATAEASLVQAKSSARMAQLQLELAEKTDPVATAEKQLAWARQRFQNLTQLAENPKTGLYVSRDSLEEQQQNIEQGELKLEQARLQRDNAIESAELGLQLAMQRVNQAEELLSVLRQMKQESRTIELSRQIAESNKENSRLIAPVDGKVLKVNGSPGETLLHTPLIQLGDLSEIICRAEVVDRLAPYLQVGQKVSLISPLYSTPISGRLEQIGRMVGTGLLSDPNPLALTDRKTIEVVITIDPDCQEMARAFINLQVTVEIDLETNLVIHF